MKAEIKKEVFRFLSLAFIFSVACFASYLVVQQSIRLSTNDPQIQIAEDTTKNIVGGSNPTSVVGQNTVDISQTLDSFVIVFDDNGNSIASSGNLHGAIPNIPSGVFAYTKTHGEDRFTWQPESGVRIAAVMTRFEAQNKGFVLVGRSLREVEKREDAILMLIFGIWLVGILVLFVFQCFTIVIIWPNYQIF